MILFRSMSNTYSGLTQKVFAITPESVFDFDRNSCSICSGMSVRFGPEFTTYITPCFFSNSMNKDELCNLLTRLRFF